MKTAPYSAPRDEWVAPEPPLALPARPRRRYGGPAAAVLLALLVGAIGFFVGIRVEKGQLPSSSAATGGTGSRLAAALAARGAGGGGGGGAASAGTGAGGGLARAFGGPGGAGANSSLGTISAVNGKTLFLTDFSGNTVKVTVSGATTITKSLGVSAKSVRPGDTVIVSGLKGSNGTIAAATVNDQGNRSAGAATGSSASPSSASSAVNSLFGSGGGG